MDDAMDVALLLPRRELNIQERTGSDDGRIMCYSNLKLMGIATTICNRCRIDIVN